MLLDCWRAFLGLFWHVKSKRKTSDHKPDTNKIIQTQNKAEPDLHGPINSLADFLWSEQSPADEVLATVSGVKLCRKDFLTLADQHWLNDEIINSYMELIMQRSQLDSSLPKVYIFNSFFYQKLCASGYQGVYRWTKGVDIFSYDLLLVPIHLGSHWSLAAIFLSQPPTIEYLDSLHIDNIQCLHALSDYLSDEAESRLGICVDSENWNIICRKNIPRQTNSSDCGVFCCAFAELIASNKGSLIDEEEIRFRRRRIAFEIYHGKLI